MPTQLKATQQHHKNVMNVCPYFASALHGSTKYATFYLVANAVIKARQGNNKVDYQPRCTTWLKRSTAIYIPARHISDMNGMMNTQAFCALQSVPKQLHMLLYTGTKDDQAVLPTKTWHNALRWPER